MVIGDKYPITLDSNCYLIKSAFNNYENFQNKFLIMIENYIMVFVLFEWIFADYMIKTQKGRKVEEILFEHNSENICAPFDQGMFKFRRIEIRNFRILATIVGFVSILFIPDLFSIYLGHGYHYYKLSLLALTAIFWTIQIIIYCKLRRNMN